MPDTVESLRKDVNTNAAALERITKYLYGNGEKGMDEVLRNNTAAVESLSKEIKEFKARDSKQQEERKESRESLRRAIILSFIPYIISFLVWIVYWIFQLQPLLEKIDKIIK